MFLVQAICLKEFNKGLLGSLIEEEIKCFESKAKLKKKKKIYDFCVMILGYIVHLKGLIFKETSQINVQCQMMSHPSFPSQYLGHYEKCNKLHFMSTF